MAVKTAAHAPAPTFAHRRYRVRAGRYVTVLVHTHLQVNSEPESCTVTVAGPRSRTRAMRHHDLAGDFEMTFPTRHVRPGRWRLSASCRGGKGAASSRARTVIRVHGGHGRGRLTSRPVFNALQPPASVGNGGVGIPRNPFPPGQCTYFAYQMRSDIYLQSLAGGALATGNKKADGSDWWDAKNWAYNARVYGHFAEGTTPVAGALMVEPATRLNPYGHVAYVTSVTNSSHFVTQEMNTDERGTMQVFTVSDDTNPNPNPTSNPSGTTHSEGSYRRDIEPGTVFVYGYKAVTPVQYQGELGHIVQWSGDTKAQKTAWLVVDEGGALHRHWIPSIAVYWCLKNSGDAGPDVLSSQELNAMPDDNGVWATCTGNSSPPGSTPGQGSDGGTYSETEGHNGVNTFTDPTTASGEGPRVAPAQQVQVSCKVYAPQIASVNPDGYWYLIASAPWNGSYYAPANTFMNGDPWDGPYTHNTDMNVPDCSPGTSPPPPPPPPPPPAQTYPETVGGPTNTWTDYTDAGGTQGPTVPAYTTVQIACRLTGFTVADGNTWWYRIASSPWSSTYYASADAFYNNGQTSGSLHGTPFVDPTVPAC